MSERGFGMTRATPCQRAACRIADGEPLGELAGNEDVVKFVGGPDAIAALEGMAGAMPSELYLLAAIRGGKSMFAAALALRSALTCDLSSLQPNEPAARVSVVSITTDLAKVTFGHLEAALRRGAGLQGKLVGKPKTSPHLSLFVRHWTGRLVEIAVVAGARAGATLVARWSVGTIFDEWTRMLGGKDGVINFTESREAVLNRQLPGAQITGIGSPHAPRGPAYESVSAHFGRPSRAVVVLRGNGIMMNPSYWTPERIERARMAPDGERAYRTDCLGEFAGESSQYFTEAELDAVTRRFPDTLPADRQGEYYAAMDPATRRNAWTLVIVKVERDPQDADRVKVIVASCRQWLPSGDKKLEPEVVLAEIRDECARYQLDEVYSDQWAVDAIASTGRMLRDGDRARPLTVTRDTATATDRDKQAANLKVMVRKREIELPPDRALRGDLLAVREVVTMRSVRPDVPTTPDGRHCDYFPALALAVHKATCGDVDWVRAMNAAARRGGGL